MQSPFKFLDSYTREDREIFFGREREIEELYQKVFEGKILFLYGVSGTGKTSLINCGLANKFEDSDWLPVSIRRGTDINTSLDSELHKAALTSFKKGTGTGEALHSIYLDHFKPVYLIFDQFEELFIFGDRQERSEFIGSIKELVESDVQCRLIFAIREEYLAGVTEFEQDIPVFLANRMRVEKMTRQHAIDVIEGPCRVHNIEVEEGFAESLLDKLNPDSNEIELTYLQVFLDKIFRLCQEYKGEMRFTLKMIDAVGDVSDLLGSFLEEQVRNMEDPETALTILKAFVSVKGTKKQVMEEEIAEFSKTLGKAVDPGSLQQIVQKFVNLRILRDKDEKGRYELRHDSLAAKIFEKITIVEKELLEIRQFIESAYENHLRRGTWLETSELDYLKPYRDRLFLSSELESFVKSSVERIEKKKKALRRISAISIVGLLLIVSVIGGYYKKRMDKSVATDWSIESLIQNEYIPGIAFETAVEAYKIDSTNALSKKALFASFYRVLDSVYKVDSLTGNWKISDSVVYRIHGESPVLYADFSAQGNLIFALLEGNRIKVWNLTGDLLHDFYIPGMPVQHLKMSEDEGYIGALRQDSTIVLIDLSQPDILKEYKTKYTSVLPLEIFNFSSDGSRMVYLNQQNRVTIIDLASKKEIQVLDGKSGIVTSVAISPDNELLAFSEFDGDIKVYRFSKETQMFNAFQKFKAHKSIVWSVSFSNNSRWILTASQDSSVKIHSLDGDTWVDSRYAYDRPEHHLSPYCHAEFRGDESVIVITAYDDKSDGEEAIRIKTIEFFSYKSPVWYTKTNKYLADSRHNFADLSTNEEADLDHQYFDYANTGKYMAASLVGENHTTLFYAFGRLPVKIIKGIQPRFSPNGMYLLCIEGPSQMSITCENF